VPARQLQFFDHPKPLLSIFDQAFFRAVPRSPGVYIMTDKCDRVLYVGQSGNLRQRLATYKNCNPNQLSRRVIRFIHQVQRISWETCGSVRAARLRENALLRLHRPKFNVMNVYPRAYAFIGLKAGRNEIALWLTRQNTNSAGLYGAFKGFANYAFAALARSLWAALHRPSSIDQFPCGILTTPKRFGLTRLCDDVVIRIAGQLSAYLEGTSPDLVDWLERSLPLGSTVSPFQQQLHATDIALLKDFFERGPQRNYRLRRQNGLEDQLILQEKLDDYIVASSPMILA
jgi:predicted GIY-YIG superfamily endonuclease